QFRQRIGTILLDSTLNEILHVSFIGSGELYTSAVSIDNANLNDAPNPGDDREVTQSKHTEAQLAYCASGISGVEIVNAERSEEDPQKNKRASAAWRSWNSHRAELRRQCLGIRGQGRRYRGSAGGRCLRHPWNGCGRLRRCACGLRQSQGAAVWRGKLGNGSVLRHRPLRRGDG